MSLTCPTCGSDALVEGRTTVYATEYLCLDCFRVLHRDRKTGSRTLTLSPAQAAKEARKGTPDPTPESSGPVVPCPTCPDCGSRKGHHVPGGCLHCPDCGNTWPDQDYL